MWQMENLRFEQFFYQLNIHQIFEPCDKEIKPVHSDKKLRNPKMFLLHPRLKSPYFPFELHNKTESSKTSSRFVNK